MSQEIIARARALIGTRFRPQGRNPDHGLDCVGLVMAVSGLDPHSVARDYRLRGNHQVRLEEGLGSQFRRIVSPRPRAGDILLLKIAEDQFHLGIQASGSIIHADANLGVVVEVPGEPAWPIVGIYRPCTHSTSGS